MSCRLVRNSPYGNIHDPVMYGSGGGGALGGIGGGILRLDVLNLLVVDGYIRANSLDLAGDRAGGSGGSGGSIYIRAGNFTGLSNSCKCEVIVTIIMLK